MRIICNDFSYQNINLIIEPESNCTFHKLKDVLVNESMAVHLEKQFVIDIRKGEL